LFRRFTMKRILFLLALLLAFFAFNFEAKAVSVESDPYPESAVQPDGFLVSMDGGPVVESPAVIHSPGSYKLRFNIDNLSSGNHTMTVKAYKNYPDPWGRKESNTVNFTFPVPAAPGGPGGFKLLP